MPKLKPFKKPLLAQNGQLFVEILNEQSSQPRRFWANKIVCEDEAFLG